MSEPDANLELTLSDLCRLADVTKRTVRYYIAKGLLPAPGAGRGVRYGQTHLDRLRTIRMLQEQHLPLAVIRNRLEVLDDKQVRAMADEPAEQSTASGYVAALLGRATRRDRTASSSASGSSGGIRATWDRLQLAPDVELHVRRPLSRPENRRVEQLIEFARDLYSAEEGDS